MPRFVQDGTDQGHLVWVKPTYQMFTQILTNPVYAGMFVYGRRVQQTRPGDPPHSFAHRLPEEEWEIVVSGVYPAYISEEQYARNREQLRANMYNFIHRHPGAPREGTALVQGLVLCGRCGRRMQVQYSKHGPRYVCRDAATRYADSTCQSFGQRYLDEAVSACFFEAIKPAQLDMLLAALSTLEQERQTRERGWQLRLERARYAVRLAERQYDAVDPENRLVARELEKRWNEALETLGNLEREYAVAQKTTLVPLTPEEQEAVRQLSQDVPAVWEAETTTMADRKRLLRGRLSSHWVALSRRSLPGGASARVRQSSAGPSNCRAAQCRRGAHADRQTLDGWASGQPAQAARHCQCMSSRTWSRRGAG